MNKPAFLRGLLWLLALLALAVVLATWRGGLWPFDLRISVMMAFSGLWGQTVALWPLWVGLAALATRGRLAALWLVGMGLALIAHGLRPGLVPLADLGVLRALALYVVPVGLALRLGALINIKA